MAFTDGEGRYRLRGAPAGEAFLEASADGQWTWTRPFLLRAGEDVALDLNLPSDGKNHPRWTIRILDPHGAPVPGAAAECVHGKFVAESEES